jgi:hypothetical protein
MVYPGIEVNSGEWDLDASQPFLLNFPHDCGATLPIVLEI